MAHDCCATSLQTYSFQSYSFGSAPVAERIAGAVERKASAKRARMDSISERSSTVDGIGFSIGLARIADEFPGDFLSEPVNAAEPGMLGEFGG